MLLTIRINIGNDAMQTSAELAVALEIVARQIYENRYVETAEATNEEIVKKIKDNNGQSVGEWSLMETAT